MNILGTYRKGHKVSKAVREKISRANTGRYFSLEMRQRMSEAHKGLHHSEKTRRKMSRAAKGKQKSPSQIENMRIAGKKRCLWGKNNPNWKGGINPPRLSKKYENWAMKVKERDLWKCQSCNQLGGILHAHHILHFRDFPNLRYEITNGITLCVKCHRRVHRRNKMKRIA